MSSSQKRGNVASVAARTLACLMLLAPAVAAAQATLQVTGSVSSPVLLTAADLKAMPRTTVTLKQDGRDVKNEGVLVGAVLARAASVARGDDPERSLIVEERLAIDRVRDDDLAAGELGIELGE